MRRFEAWGRPQIKPFDVKFSPFSVKFVKWRNQPLMISSVDGALNVGLSRVELSGAWAAFPAYPNACLIYAIGVPWRGHADLAKKLRDRWVEEGFVYYEPAHRRASVPEAEVNAPGRARPHAPPPATAKPTT